MAIKQEMGASSGLDPLDPLDPLSNAEFWHASPSFEMMNSPKVSPASTVMTHTPSVGGQQSSNSEVSYNNVLSENAIEALQKQQDQNKLIHLDPIPDFKDKSEVKPWLQKIFYPQGIEIVIERSDSMKIVFKCKAVKKARSGVAAAAAAASSGSGVAGSSGHFLGCAYVGMNTNPMLNKGSSKKKDGSGNNARCKDEKCGGDGSCENSGANDANTAENATASSNSNSNSTTSTGKKKRVTDPYNSCPFRVRATFSLKRKKWNIVVINNVHTHPLRFNPDSEDYKKFKKGLYDSGDIETVKKFDELEYRTKSNLPIDLSPIPCDCGLTQEIQSFNIVLPTTNIIASTSRAGSSDANTVSKPKKCKNSLKKKSKKLRLKNTKQKLQQDIESNSAHTSATGTPLGNVPNTLNLQFDVNMDLGVQSTSGSNMNSSVVLTPQENIYSHDFFPNTASSQRNDSPNFSNLNPSYFNTENEIDFTELFSKPLPHFKNNQQPVPQSHDAIPLSFSHKPSNSGIPETHHSQAQGRHMLYQNVDSTPSTHSSPSMNVMTTGKNSMTITPALNTATAATGPTQSSVPLYSSDISKEQIQDFVDMNQIFGTSEYSKDRNSNSNTPNSVIPGRSLNFQHSRLPTSNQHQNQSAICEINNYDVCANDFGQCGGVGAGVETNSHSNTNSITLTTSSMGNGINSSVHGYDIPIKTELTSNPQEYISNVLNTDFNELKLSQDEQHQQQGGMNNLGSQSNYNYQLMFDEELNQPQQTTHNPHTLWEEPHGFLQ